LSPYLLAETRLANLVACLVTVALACLGERLGVVVVVLWSLLVAGEMEGWAVSWELLEQQAPQAVWGVA
jgi:hypothetical protein